MRPFVLNSAEMFLLDQKAKRYGQRPAVLLLIDPHDEPLLANSIDNAAYLWGAWIEGKLGETDDKGKQLFTLEQLLDTTERKAAPRFRSVGKTRDI